MCILNGSDMYVVNFSGSYGDQKDDSNTWNAGSHVLDTTEVRNDDGRRNTKSLSYLSLNLGW